MMTMKTIRTKQLRCVAVMSEGIVVRQKWSKDEATSELMESDGNIELTDKVTLSIESICLLATEVRRMKRNGSMWASKGKKKMNFINSIEARFN
jgi:hypothetical protein